MWWKYKSIGQSLVLLGLKCEYEPLKNSIKILSVFIYSFIKDDNSNTKIKALRSYIVYTSIRVDTQLVFFRKILMHNC
jgi:hypothetical protein